MQMRFGGDPEETRRQLDEMVKQATERAEQFENVRHQVEAATVTETAGNGAVRATVASSGALTELRLGDQAREMSLVELADQVRRCIQRAQARIGDRVQQIVQDTVTEDSETARNVVASFRDRFPEPPPDEASAPGRFEPGVVQMGQPAEDDEAPPAQRLCRRRPDDGGDFSDRSWLH